MAKIKLETHIDPKTGEKWAHDQYLYWCEGCGYEHAFALKHEEGHHTWNGDFNNPTVEPSLLHNSNPKEVCHSFIRNGMIQYLTDCYHELKGKTILLPDVDEKIRQRKKYIR